MGLLTQWGARVFAFLASAAGLAIWLGGVALLIYAATRESVRYTANGEPILTGLTLDIAIRSGLIAIGALLGLVASVVLLRLTGRITTFLICLAFGALAFVGGATWRPPVETYATESAETESDEVVADAAPPPPAADDEAAAPAPPPLTDVAPRAEAPPAVVAAPEAPADSAPAELQAAPRSRSLQPPASAEEPLAAAPPPPAEMAAPPVAVAPPAAAAAADAKPSDFQVAELKFNKPAEMQIDTPYVVAAAIAGALAETQATLGNVGPTVSRQTSITRKVRVELVASDFEVKKLHTIDTVLITPETTGQWSWEVIPKREGADRKMLLQVWGVLERDGVAQGDILIKTYEETIPVKVTPIARVRLVSQGIIDRWQPLAGALGVIGGIWVFLQKLLGSMRPRRKEEPV